MDAPAAPAAPDATVPTDVEKGPFDWFMPGSSTGAKVGVLVAVIVALVCVAVATRLVLRRWRQQRELDDQEILGPKALKELFFSRKPQTGPTPTGSVRPWAWPKKKESLVVRPSPAMSAELPMLALNNSSSVWPPLGKAGASGAPALSKAAGNATPLAPLPAGPLPPTAALAPDRTGTTVMDITVGPAVVPIRDGEPWHQGLGFAAASEAMAGALSAARAPSLSVRSDQVSDAPGGTLTSPYLSEDLSQPPPVAPLPLSVLLASSNLQQQHLANQAHATATIQRVTGRLYPGERDMESRLHAVLREAIHAQSGLRQEVSGSVPGSAGPASSSALRGGSTGAPPLGLAGEYVPPWGMGQNSPPSQGMLGWGRMGPPPGGLPPPPGASTAQLSSSAGTAAGVGTSAVVTSAAGLRMWRSTGRPLTARDVLTGARNPPPPDPAPSMRSSAGGDSLAGSGRQGSLPPHMLHHHIQPSMVASASSSALPVQLSSRAGSAVAGGVRDSLSGTSSGNPALLYGLAPGPGSSTSVGRTPAPVSRQPPGVSPPVSGSLATPATGPALQVAGGDSPGGALRSFAPAASSARSTPVGTLSAATAAPAVSSSSAAAAQYLSVFSAATAQAAAAAAAELEGGPVAGRRSRNRMPRAHSEGLRAPLAPSSPTTPRMQTYGMHPAAGFAHVEPSPGASSVGSTHTPTTAGGIGAGPGTLSALTTASAFFRASPPVLLPPPAEDAEITAAPLSPQDDQPGTSAQHTAALWGGLGPALSGGALLPPPSTPASDASSDADDSPFIKPAAPLLEEQLSTFQAYIQTAESTPPPPDWLEDPTGMNAAASAAAIAAQQQASASTAASAAATPRSGTPRALRSGIVSSERLGPALVYEPQHGGVAGLVLETEPNTDQSTPPASQVHSFAPTLAPSGLWAHDDSDVAVPVSPRAGLARGRGESGVGAGGAPSPSTPPDHRHSIGLSSQFSFVYGAATPPQHTPGGWDGDRPGGVPHAEPTVSVRSLTSQHSSPVTPTAPSARTRAAGAGAGGAGGWGAGGVHQPAAAAWGLQRGKRLPVAAVDDGADSTVTPSSSAATGATPSTGGRAGASTISLGRTVSSGTHSSAATQLISPGAPSSAGLQGSSGAHPRDQYPDWAGGGSKPRRASWADDTTTVLDWSGAVQNLAAQGVMGLRGRVTTEANPLYGGEAQGPGRL